MEALRKTRVLERKKEAIEQLKDKCGKVSVKLLIIMIIVRKLVRV